MDNETIPTVMPPDYNPQQQGGSGNLSDLAFKAMLQPQPQQQNSMLPFLASTAWAQRSPLASIIIGLMAGKEGVQLGSGRGGKGGSGNPNAPTIKNMEAISRMQKNEGSTMHSKAGAMKMMFDLQEQMAASNRLNESEKRAAALVKNGLAPDAAALLTNNYHNQMLGLRQQQIDIMSHHASSMDDKQHLGEQRLQLAKDKFDFQKNKIASDPRFQMTIRALQATRPTAGGGGDKKLYGEAMKRMSDVMKEHGVDIGEPSGDQLGYLDRFMNYMTGAGGFTPTPAQTPTSPTLQVPQQTNDSINSFIGDAMRQ